MAASAAIAATTTSCGEEEPVFLKDPVLTSNPNPSAPLVAKIDFATRIPTRANLIISDDKNTWTLAFDQYATDHSLTALGFRPDRSHVIRVKVIDESGHETLASEDLKLTTDPLPKRFPPLEVAVSKPERMEPGVTLFSAIYWPNPILPDLSFGLLVIVDDAGDVVWYYSTDGRILDARRLSNGNIVYGMSPTAIVEIDMLGNVIQRWHAGALGGEAPQGSTTVDTDTFHHDITQLPSGNLLVLGTELRSVDSYPTSENDPTAPTVTTSVVGDVILELGPGGAKVGEWSLFDIIDPYRIGYGFLEPVWNTVYTDASGSTSDWTHGNSVVYDARDDSMIVSLRHQDAIIKISRSTGQLVWIFGPHDGWKQPWSQYLLKPEGQLEWPYHQHGVMLTPKGNLLLYDNGNYRASPFAPKTAAIDNYSRAVEFSIDEQKLMTSQVWAYGGKSGESFYSPWLGDVDVLPNTGNILVTDGGRSRDANGKPSDDVFGGHHWARVLEVTHTTPADKVFELVIDDCSKTPHGWSVYGAERLNSLYR